MNTQRKLSTREKVAAGISAAIILVTVIYWIMQVAGVMEMLRQVYG